MTDLLQWGSLRFPEGGTLLSRAGGGFGFVRGHRRSAALVAAATIGVAAAGYLGVGYVRYQRLATADQATIARTERANVDLQDALARLRDQVGAANQALSVAQSRVAALSEETTRQVAVSEQAATSKIDRIAELTRELHLTEAQRVTLMARLSKAEADLAKGQVRQQQAEAGLGQWQKQIQQLTADRDKAASERDRLRARVSQLEQKLAALPTREAPRPMAQAQPQPAQPVAQAQARPAPTAAVAAAVPAPAPAAAPIPPVAVARAQPPQVAAPVTTVATSGRLAQFQRVLASAGVDVERLFAQYGVRTGEGGPFVPVPRDGKLPTLSPQKFAALTRLMKALPVSAPLASYRIGSPFGVRGDPLNGRHEFHTGVDMLAPYMSPVYATAPGVVTFSGYRDDYGKVVEIDHGNGITTRYAHLHRQTVSVGQHVTAHTQIGFLGSTGRATGPHLHYEVLVNGEPENPVKFFGLAHLIQVAQRE